MPEPLSKESRSEWCGKCISLATECEGAPTLLYEGIKPECFEQSISWESWNVDMLDDIQL